MTDLDELMIGASESLCAAVRLLRRYADCDAPVLIEGETGTGKELAARQLHYAGPRRARAFVPVNCGALPDTLIEAELFGHRRGAFTDARTARAGLVDHARGGTLFLDEVDALSGKGQVTLLRFLQDRCYRPVGESQSVQADVRVVAATNTPLESLVRAGRFRHDLYYRLSPLCVCLPPLRERGGDVAQLAQHFLDQAARRMGAAAKRWSAQALQRLRAYAWPGNVRELENVSLRAFLHGSQEEIGVAELSLVLPALAAAEPAAAQDGAISPFTVAKARAIATFERGYLTELMRHSYGNVSEAARLCGTERRQLGKLLKKHGIDGRDFRQGMA